MLPRGVVKSWHGYAVAAFLVAGSAESAVAAETAFASNFDKAQTSSARLVAGGRDSGGVYLAGVEIDLEPKTVTYWRQPGDAGSPPVFDFSRSQNVASVETLYPAPKHMNEAGSIVAGYDTAVTFPLRVTPRDQNAPVVLDLALDYAACGKICLPARARLSLRLPNDGASSYHDQIDRALAVVPRKLTTAEAKTLFELRRRDGLPNVWRLEYLGRGRALDLFTEAPESMFLDSVRADEGRGFDLKLVSSSGGAVKLGSAVTATVTLVTDQGAFEAQARLE